MPKFVSKLKSLISNKEKLFELARTPLNEHCSAVFLKKLPEKLGDPDKFLIPCEFLGMDECLALADLGASINLMPLSVWKKLSLTELTPTCMTLKLPDRSISQQIGIAEDVYVKENKYLLEKKCTFNLDQTSRYSSNYDDNSVNRIDVIDMDCEEYSQEVLGFSDVIASGNPTPYYDPIVSTSSLTLTPFEDSDFLLEEVDAFLALEDDPTSLEVDHSYYDSKGGGILLLEAFLNDDPSFYPHHSRKDLLGIQKRIKVFASSGIGSKTFFNVLRLSNFPYYEKKQHVFNILDTKSVEVTFFKLVMMSSSLRIRHELIPFGRQMHYNCLSFLPNVEIPQRANWS
ncbi:reverse transcriptase domain-containing protein [Tanacetum coccineum]